LSSIPACRKRVAMKAPSDKLTREERLAAKLRENLRRRKAQGREVGRALDETPPDPLPKPPSRS
jgi:hypothetical protein